MGWWFEQPINPWIDEAREREILQANNATSAPAPTTIASSSTSASTSITHTDPYVCTLPLPDRSTGWKPTYTREDLDRAGLDTNYKQYLIKNFLEPRLNGLPKDGPAPWPDPHERMIRMPTSEMFRSFKPGRESGFRPVNTLDSKPTQSPRTASKQYGKPAMGAGQTKFLEYLNDQSDEPLKTPDTPKSSRARRAEEPSHPSKCAKSHRNASPSSDLAEVRDTNDIIISSSPPGAIGDPLAAVLHDSAVYPAKKRKALSAMSQQSQGSATSSQLKRKSPPTSAFQATDALGNSHRKKTRRLNIVRPWMESEDGYGCHQSPTPSPEPSPEPEFIAQTGERADQAISLSDDEDPSPQKVRDRKLLGRLEKKRGQVLVEDDGSEDELHVQEPATVSKFFVGKTNGSSRINHSTEPRRGEVKTSSASDMVRNEKLQEKFQRRDDPNDPIESDELGTAEVAPPHRLNKSPSKRTAQANTAVTRKSQTETQHGWPLEYVRTYDIEEHGPNLYMKQTSDKRSFSIDRYDGEATAENVAKIELGKLTKASADDTSHIRLQGSMSTDGAAYWFDIEFTNIQDHVEFRDSYVKQACLHSKIYHKEQHHMETLFAKPLEHHRKPTPTVTMPIVEQDLLEKRIQNGATRPEQRRTRRNLLLIDQLDSKSTDLTLGRSTRAVQNGLRPRNSAPSEAISRPIRATRSTLPAASGHADDGEIKDPNGPVPYSEDPGLGEPWRKSLTFHGSGRKRALVDFEDLIRLDDGQYLNDQLIDFYMIYLFEQANVPKNKVYFFNTHFFTALTRPVPGQKGVINYAAVARWTAKEDIFNYDYIVVPVCEANHWYLAIICNVSNIPREPAITGLEEDSPTPKLNSEAPIKPSFENPVDAKTDQDAAEKSTAQVDITMHSSEPEEEVNLFDEEQHNRRNPSAEIAAMFDEMNGKTQNNSGSSRQSPTTAQTTRMEKLTIDESIPKGILGDVTSSPPAAKKKGKRKSMNTQKKYDTEEPIILVLDSLGLTHPKAVKALKDYLLEEGRAKRSMDAVLTQNTFYVRQAHIPQQKNFYDCGVYLLGYSQKFFEDPRTFVTSILLREMDASTDWPNMSAPKIRNSMRDILQGLARQQDRERKAEHKAKQAEKSVEMDAVETKPTQKLAASSKSRSQTPLEATPPTVVETRVKSLEKTAPKAEVQTKSEAQPHEFSKKGSPEVLISSKSQVQEVRLPKRRLEESQIDEEQEGGGVTSCHSSRPSSPTKRRKVDEGVKADLPELTKVPPGAFRSSPDGPRKPTNGPRTQRLKNTAQPQRSTDAAHVTNAHRGSSEDPIQIDDSQDSVEARSTPAAE